MKIFDSSRFSVDLTEGESSSSELTVRGRVFCIWPNREGEGFTLESAAPALKRYGCTDSGISLSWPATASTRSILLKSEGASILIRKVNDNQGRHEEIRIFADDTETVRFRFTGPHGEFEVSELSDIKNTTAADAVPPDLKTVPRQFQLGLIGPEGECNLPAPQGFKAIVPLAQEILKIFPDRKAPPLLHLFGYAAGHDRAYPDYTPSAKLGGTALFTEVIAELKSMGFKISLYMNARLLDASKREAFPHLQDSILKDSRDEIITEEYFDRKFYVMNPDSAAWREELYSQANNLKQTGADMIQLDQIAGRAAPVPPGSPWGKGYADLIRNIKEEELEVWIQGVSDYYPADCFEMTWKDLEIMEGGVLRGGNPFGKTDLSLLKALKQRDAFTGTLLTPLDKRNSIDTEQFTFRLDMMDRKGLLPLYGPGYIQKLKELSILI